MKIIILFIEATKFYDSLAGRIIKNGYTVDIYACSLDQTGLTEMKNIFSKSGG